MDSTLIRPNQSQNMEKVKILIHLMIQKDYFLDLNTFRPVEDGINLYQYLGLNSYIIYEGGGYYYNGCFGK